VYQRLSPLATFSQGYLSDIARKVTPLVLDTGEHAPVRRPSKVRCEGERVYLVSEHTLHCFNKDGHYIGAMTDPSEILVADYMIVPGNDWLIVLGNEEDVYYYTLDGELKYKTQFPGNPEWERLKTITFHNEHIWAMKQVTDPATGRIEHAVVEYDLLFTELNTYSLGFAETGRDMPLFSCVDPVFSVAPDTGELYVYSPSHTPEYLLRDTLYIRQHRPLANLYAKADISVYPVRMGERFYLSSSLSAGDNEYFYCYDQETNRCWQLPDGITDDLYKGGRIRHFYPMDLTGEMYWYANSSSSELTEEVAVIYLVELKRA